MSTNKPRRKTVFALTPFEANLLALRRQGLSNIDIAEITSLSIKAISSHVARAVEKERLLALIELEKYKVHNPSSLKRAHNRPIMSKL